MLTTPPRPPIVPQKQNLSETMQTIKHHREAAEESAFITQPPTTMISVGQARDRDDEHEQDDVDLQIKKKDE